MTWFYKEWNKKTAKAWNDIVPSPNGKCVLKSIMFLIKNNSSIPQFNSIRYAYNNLKYAQSKRNKKRKHNIKRH